MSNDSEKTLNEWESEEFTVAVGRREIHPILISPPKDRIALEPGLLLNFTGRRDDSLLGTKGAALVTKRFLAQGYRVLGFDLPNFGSRMDEYGKGITGLGKAFVNGGDPFSAFVEDTVAVIDTCVEHNWAIPGRIAICGTSRGAYFALRAMAADPRIGAGAGFAPVTDWRDLTEFREYRHRTDIAALRLACFARQLAGRTVFLCIGNHDERVSTVSCCRFFLSLSEANQSQGNDGTSVDFFCAPEEGHTCGDEWYRRGSESLLNGIVPPRA
jgi:dienelactone hydrolase